MMNNTCWVRYCENFGKPNPSVILYPAPIKLDEKQIWSKAFGIPIEKFNINTRVCALHFVHKNHLQILDHMLTGVQPYEKSVTFHVPMNQQKNVPDNESASTLVPASQSDYIRTSNERERTMMENLLSCDLFLDCQDEELTEVQQNYQNQEWLSYCKFNASIHNLSSARIETNDFANSSELPVLVFSNAPPTADIPACSQPEMSQAISHSQAFPQVQVIPRGSFFPPRYTQSILLPPVSNTVGQSLPYSVQVPNANPINSIVNKFSPTVMQMFNNQPMIAPKPSVIPMQLQAAPKEVTPALISVASPQPGQTNEEVFPLVLQDGMNSAVQEQVQNSISPKPVMISIPEPPESSHEINHEPTFGEDSGGSRSLSPNLLSKVEVSIEEEPAIEFPAVVSEPNPSNILITPPIMLSDNTDGPKIMNVMSGNAGAKEFYKDMNTPVNLNIFSTANKNDGLHLSSPPEAEKAMPKTVTQWSIFSMQKTIAVISSGTKEGNPRNLLRIRCCLPPHAASGDAATRLRNSLREGNFLTLSIWWLIHKQYLPMVPPCICNSKVFRINSCMEFPDKLCWSCDKCSLVYQVKRPKFYERFPQMCIEELMLLTYHWACKSQHQFLNKDLHIPDDLVFNFFHGLQELCGIFINENCILGKNNPGFPSTVEISAVKLGKFFIICAFCRRSKLTRLKAITTDDACSTLAHIDAIKQMVGQNSIIISWKRIDPHFLPGYTTWSADPALTNVLSTGRHILNASKYLGKTMVELFQNINHDHLDLKTVQGYLNEVMWRDRFGRNEENAFWNIMAEITRDNDKNFSDAVLGDIKQDRFFYKQDIAFQMRWGPYQFSSSGPISNTLDEQAILKAIQETVMNTATKIRNSHTLYHSTSAAIPPIAKPPPTPSATSILAPPITPKAVPQVTLAPKLAMSVPLTETIKVAAPVQSRAVSRHPMSYTSPATTISTFREPPDSISAKDMLTVRINFNNNLKFQEALKNESMKLAEQLALEGFVLNPVRWLVKKKLIGDISSCYICHGIAKLVDDRKQQDGVIWICQSPGCRFQNKFRRPNFFGNFGFQMEILFCIIFHWAVQSEYKVMKKSIPLNEYNIICVHRKLQRICSSIKKRPSVLIGGSRVMVEVALVKFANCFILGAMERSTKFSRFQAFSMLDKLHVDQIRNTMISWMRPDTTVIVTSSRYFGQYNMSDKVKIVYANRNITDPASKGYHTLTISSYLQNHMKTMFANVKVQYLKAEVLQLYLDELMWRERYGRSPVLAFKNIMQDIFLTEFKAQNVVPNFDIGSRSEDISTGVFILPETRVVLERLPYHVIEKYLNPDADDEVELLEVVEKKNIVEAEITISDDELDEVNAENSNSASSVSKDSSNPAPQKASDTENVLQVIQGSDSSCSVSRDGETPNADRNELFSATCKLKELLSGVDKQISAEQSETGILNFVPLASTTEKDSVPNVRESVPKPSNSHKKKSSIKSSISNSNAKESVLIPNQNIPPERDILSAAVESILKPQDSNKEKLSEDPNSIVNHSIPVASNSNQKLAEKDPVSIVDESVPVTLNSNQNSSEKDLLSINEEYVPVASNSNQKKSEKSAVSILRKNILKKTSNMNQKKSSLSPVSNVNEVILIPSDSNQKQTAALPEPLIDVQDDASDSSLGEIQNYTAPPIEPQSEQSNKVPPLKICLSEKRKIIRGGMPQNYLTPITDRVKKRMTDQSYCHRNKKMRISGDKFQCIECKEICSENHFTKEYNCDDCKIFKYTTFCRKAFAEHRSYVLFGRQMAGTKVEPKHFHHKIRLEAPWHCPCGFYSVDGNMLASHLVKCGKKTCYLSDDYDSDEEIDIL